MGRIRGEFLASPLALAALFTAAVWPLVGSGPARAAPACPRMTVVGHRGSPATAPENTMASFAAAVRDGADWLETDVLVSKDGVPVILHDSTLERLTGTAGRVADLTVAELDRLRITVGPGDPQPIPHLTDLLDWVRAAGVHLLLEIKEIGRPEDATTIGRLAAASGADIEITSFYPEHLKAAHAAAPDLPLTLIQGSWYARDPEGLPLAAVAVEHVLATPERTRAEHAAGRAVYGWIANDSGTWQTLRANGVDALITDAPGAARAWLDQQPTSCGGSA
ncbi:glycerophosphodiester phosphodiesterase [Kitasatospora terrestris]